MIRVRRLQGEGTLVLNADLIESVESCPDTVITLVTKRRYVVADSLDDVLASVVDFRARVAEAISATNDHSIGARALAATEHDQDKAA